MQYSDPDSYKNKEFILKTVQECKEELQKKDVFSEKMNFCTNVFLNELIMSFRADQLNTDQVKDLQKLSQ